jgi:hypothetical protein
MGKIDVIQTPAQVLDEALVKKGINPEMAAYAAEYLGPQEVILYLDVVKEVSEAHLKAFLIERFPEKAQEVFADSVSNHKSLEVVDANYHNRRTGDS